jgi:branched-chain amino acid transport system permease protein
MAQPASILIIDDEEIIREALEALLVVEGYRVASAATAGQGMEMLGNGSVDAVLLDLMLPDKNGLEVLEDIRRLDDELPVVMITAFGTIEGAVAATKQGAFYYFTNQNWAIFNGHTGINNVAAPQFWGVEWGSGIAFYYLVLGVAALCYLAVAYIARAPFGLALQGVRDNPRRMAALGFNVNAHRVAAYALAALIAGLGGVLQVWNYKQISPGSVGVERCIDILIIAVVGGITRPAGAFIGASFVILRTFTLDVLVKIDLDGNRFRLLIGLVFLAIVLWSSDGVIGLWERWREQRAAPDAA